MIQKDYFETMQLLLIFKIPLDFFSMRHFFKKEKPITTIFLEFDSIYTNKLNEILPILNISDD